MIELIVVIAILGILALFLVPQFMGYSQDAKEQVAKANTRSVWSAANAALTKSEYIKDLDITTDAKEQLGSSFKSEVTISIKTNTTTGKKYVESVTYENCSYNGTEFSGTACPKE